MIANCSLHPILLHSWSLSTKHLLIHASIIFQAFRRHQSFLSLPTIQLRSHHLDTKAVLKGIGQHCFLRGDTWRVFYLVEDKVTIFVKGVAHYCGSLANRSLLTDLQAIKVHYIQCVNEGTLCHLGTLNQKHHSINFLWLFCRPIVACWNGAENAMNRSKLCLKHVQALHEGFLVVQLELSHFAVIQKIRRWIWD